MVSFEISWVQLSKCCFMCLFPHRTTKCVPYYFKFGRWKFWKSMNKEYLNKLIKLEFYMKEFIVLLFKIINAFYY